MSFHQDLKNAIAKVTVDSKLFHDVVHGSANTTVTTESGPVKTVAKTLEDIETHLNTRLSSVFQAAQRAQAAQHQAEIVRNEALQAKESALSAIGGVKASHADLNPQPLYDKIVTAHGLESTLVNKGNGEVLEVKVARSLEAATHLYLAQHFI